MSARPSLSERLLNLALRIAIQPRSWRQFVDSAISGNTLALDDNWPQAAPYDELIAGAWQPPRPPERLGFLVACLAFLHAFFDRGRYSDELLYVGLSALEQPLSDTRLAQMRVDLCQRLLPLATHVEHRIYVLNETGSSYANSTEVGRHDQQLQAIDLHRQALRLCDRQSLPLHYATIQVCLGAVYKERVSGDRTQNLTDAIAYYRSALDVYDDPALCGDYVEVARERRVDVSNNLGNALRVRRDATGGSVRESLACFQRALSECRDDAVTAELLRNQSLTYLRLTDQREANVNRAIDGLEKALAIYARCPAPVWQALTWLNLGFAYSQRENDGGRRLAIDAYEQALALYRRLEIRREAMRCLANLGALHAGASDWPAAAVQFDEAARLLEEELREAETQQARHAWRRLTSDIYDGLIASHAQLAQSGGPAAKGAGKGLSTYQPAEQAAAWCEIARAKNLADWVSLGQQPPRGVSQRDFDMFCQGERELRDLDEQIAVAEHYVAEWPQARLTVDELQTVRRQLFDKQRRARRGFQQSDPNWAPEAAPLTIDEQRQVARDEQAALLTLRPTPWGTCAALITPEGTVASALLPALTWVEVNRMLGVEPGADEDSPPQRGWRSDAQRLPKVREAVDAAEQELHHAQAQLGAEKPASEDGLKRCKQALDALQKAEADFFEAELDWHETLESFPRQLGQALWRPLREWLRQHYPPGDNATELKPLIVLPGWGFNVLPLHAANWREPGEDTAHWACDDYCFSYAPSIWMLRRCQERRPTTSAETPTLLAVRNPTGDLELADWEVDATVADFPGRYTILGGSHNLDVAPALHDSTLTALQKHSIALLSSHGCYDARDPWRGSGVFLAKDDDAPSLTVRDFFSIDLSQLSLAVLSACETAGVDATDATGEQLGLPSALLAAGVPTVVATHWEVDDFPSALLVQRFFQELLSGASLREKNQALARAQRWLRRLTRAEVKTLHQQACQHAPVGAAR